MPNIILICLIIAVAGVIIFIITLVLMELSSPSRKDDGPKLVTVGSYMHMDSAQAAQIKLQSEDIGSFLAYEHTMTMLPYLSPAIGGVKVNVRQEDAQRALEILHGPPPIPKNGATFGRSQVLGTPETGGPGLLPEDAKAPES